METIQKQKYITEIIETTESNNPPQLLTILQVINLFHISPQYESHLRKEGKVPIISIGKQIYYSVSDAIAFLNLIQFNK